MGKAAIPGLGGGVEDSNITSGRHPNFLCSEDMRASALLLTCLGSLGITSNLLLVCVVVARRSICSLSHGLLIHQAVVDGTRSAILLPLGQSILKCEPISKCSLVETTFLLLVTVSTVNLLSVVLNSAPILPEQEEQHQLPGMLRDNPQCVAFGLFMIWFASITVNLGPTFLSGALAANAGTAMDEPSCPLVQGPYRHYVLNAIWILINLLCILLTIFHLHKLHKDFTRVDVMSMSVQGLLLASPSRVDKIKAESPECCSCSMEQIQVHSLALQEYWEKLETENISRVKMYTVVTAAYLVFWGPLFLVTLVHWSVEWSEARTSVTHQVCLHVAFVHAFINPLLFLLLNKSLRAVVMDCLCCSGEVCRGSGKIVALNGGGATVRQNGVVAGTRKETAI